ncbi:MAG: hypothetical protein FWC39_13640, partial [Bacteroidetes bacterium]|nr:hypothetical protein [Bacteroidota bacterium]
MKTTKTFIKILFTGMACMVGMNSVWAQTPPAGMILISGTRFEIPSKAADAYGSLDEITYIGLVKPSITHKMTLIPNANAGTFKGGKYYAVTNNPAKLGTAADGLYDNGNAYWGLVLSRQNDDGMLTFTVPGVKTTAAAHVEIEYCIAVRTGRDTPPGTGNGTAQFKVAVSGREDAFNLIHGQDVPQLDLNNNPGGGCKTYSATISAADVAKSGGTLTVYLNAKQLSNVQIVIKSIYVYGQINPKISGTAEACVGGESAILSVASTYEGTNTYQWYRGTPPSGTLLTGATGLFYKHTTNLTTPATTTYYYTMTPQGGAAVTSETFTVKDIVCCTDAQGKPASRKLIWQDDFGTFTSARSFWVWDYSDIANPKKVVKTAPNDWRRQTDGANGSNPPYVMPNAVYVGTGDVPEQPGPKSGYAIIANVAQNVNGLNWSAKAGNGTQWTGANYFPDHTYPDREAYGGMLMINCSGVAGETLYDRTITGLCDKKLTIKCFINNFSDGALPVQVTISATDLAAGGATASATVSRHATNDGLAWKEVSFDLALKPGSTSINFKITSSQTGATNGNDLLLDDIQIYACSTPSVDVYFDNFKTAVTTCDGSDVTLNADQTVMLTNFYGTPNYIFQYSFEDPNAIGFNKNTSWKTINTTPQASVSRSALASIFTAYKVAYPTGKQVYFRVVAADAATLNYMITQGKVFNADDPCSNYSVSDPIVANIDCPKCTSPKDIKITPSGGAQTGGTGTTPYTVTLCGTESVTLNTNDVAQTSPAYNKFTTQWYKGDKTTKTGAAGGSKAPTLTVNAADVIAAGGTLTYYVQAVDADFPTVTTCHKWDEIIIKASPTPTVNPLSPITLCAGDSQSAISLSGTPTGVTFDWARTGSTTTGVGASGTGTTSIGAFTAGNVSTQQVSTITITPKANGCTGTPTNFT